MTAARAGLWPAFLLLVLIAVAACGGGSDRAPVQPAGSNLFANPGLEDGEEPWFALLEDGGGFTVSAERAHGGAASARLVVEDGRDARGTKVYYLIQEMAPEDFPEVVSGYYRVEEWEPGAPKQYLQFAVIVFAPANFPPRAPNYQLRYILGGIDEEPFAIGNAKFVFLGRDEPKEGRWVPFEARVRDDFQQLWGMVPEDFEKIRVLFEVRWEDKEPGEGEPRADVYYDDLYMGPAAP